VALAAARELVASPALGAAARRALVARVAALRSDAGAVRALLALLSGGPPLGAGELRDLVALVGRHGGEAAVAEGLAELVPRAVRGLDTGACSALRRDLARAMDQNPQLVPPLLRALRGGHDDRLWAREHSLRAADASLRLLPRAAAEAVLSALLEDLDEDCAALVAGQGSATTTESLEHDAWAAVDLVIAAAELGGGVSEGLPLAVHVAQHLVHSSGGAAALALAAELATSPALARTSSAPGRTVCACRGRRGTGAAARTVRCAAASTPSTRFSAGRRGNVRGARSRLSTNDGSVCR
jgi:hypothetical protein